MVYYSLEKIGNGVDKIGLEDRAFSDLSINQITSGDFSGDVEIKDKSSNKILFVLEKTDVNLIDADDFMLQTLFSLQVALICY